MQKNNAYILSTPTVEKFCVLHMVAVEKKVLGRLRKFGFST